jgi:UDP-N-acetylenolpyruvoylglucosamine reductase
MKRAGNKFNDPDLMKWGEKQEQQGLDAITGCPGTAGGGRVAGVRYYPHGPARHA